MLAAFYTGSVDFGAGALPGNPTEPTKNLAVLQLDTAGVTRWSVALLSQGFMLAEPLATDGESNAIVGGAFVDTLSFPGGQLHGPPYPATTPYVIKLDGDGHVLWSKEPFKFVTPPGLQDGASQVAGIAADRHGNLMITGTVSGAADFGGGVLEPIGWSDIFVGKLDPAGALLWVRRFGSSYVEASGQTPSASSGIAVAVDPDGDVYVTGSFAGSIDFGDDHPVKGLEHRIFLLKLDAMGHVLWSVSGGSGSVENTGTNVAVDPMGDVIITGRYGNSLDLGAGPLPSFPSGNYTPFVAKFLSSGVPIWSHGYLDGEQGTSIDAYVAVDLSGNGHLAGTLYGSLDLGGVTLHGTHSDDAFLALFDPGGQVLYAETLSQAGSPSSQAQIGATAIAVAPACMTLVAGSFFQAWAPGTSTPSAGGIDIFLAARVRRARFLHGADGDLVGRHDLLMDQQLPT